MGKTSLPDKEDFYNHLDMEDITDGDYVHAKRVFKDFKIKKLGEYHDLYIQRDTLLLGDVFQNFRNMSWNIWTWSCKISFSSWQASLQKTKVKLDPLTDIDMLSMIEKGIRTEIRHSIFQYVKTKNKYMKDYDKNKESSNIQYWDVNNLYGCEMLQKLPVNNFEWIDNFPFNEDFIRNYNEEKDQGYFLKVDAQYLENYMNFIMIYHFYLRGWRLKKPRSL